MSVLGSTVVEGARFKRGDKHYEVDHVNGEGHGAIVFARRLGVQRATPRPWLLFADCNDDAEWSADDTGALKT